MDAFPPLERRELPPPPHWTAALGVGVVVMGLAMGTGELVLWPHLVAKHGLSLLWLALVGITCQYFLNQEIARHVLATGEGFFTSSARIMRWSPAFWFFSAILLYIWPGWASAIGTVLRELFGFGTHLGWAWTALGLVLVLTASGRVAYAMLERSLKITVPAFFLMLVAISFFNLTLADIAAALRGIMSFGAIPPGVDMTVLLGAVVFAGAGGMLNLCVSLWYRDKQIGMGRYAGRITNPITGREEAVATTGHAFDADDPENLARWRGWMRYVRIDQGIIFWALGFTTLFLLSANAHAVLVPRGIVSEGLQVAVAQARIFGDQWGTVGLKLFLAMADQWGTVGLKLFLAMASLMLFSVMWTVIDALSRMTSDMLYINSRTGPFRPYISRLGHLSLGKLYYGIVGMVVVVGAVLLPFRQPLTLLVISGALGGISMAVYTPLLIYLNNARLPKALRPGWFTNGAMTLIAAFFIFFAFRVIISYF